MEAWKEQKIELDCMKDRSRRNSEEFLLVNRLPWAWVLSLADLGGKVWLVGLALRKLASLQRSKAVRFNTRNAKLPLSRSSIRRGIKALERAELIEVERRPGSCLTITLMDAPASEPGIEKKASNGNPMP